MGERIENKIESRFNPEIVSELEKTPFLTDEDKMILLLTLIGEKPVAHLGLRFDFDSTPEKEKKFLDENDFLRKWLGKSSLVFSSEEKIISGEDGPLIKTVEFNVARDKTALNRVDRAMKEDNEEELGLAFGYPATAVEAYCKGDVKNRDSYSFDLNYSEASDFLFFRLSKEHWAEEFEKVKQWQRAIKDNFPGFYKQFTDLRPKIDSLRLEHPEEFKIFLNSEEKMQAIKQRDEKLYQELMREKQEIGKSHQKREQ